MTEFNLPKIFNWEKAHNKIVKKYVAHLSQSGTDAPVATELYNDTGVAFTYNYDLPGSYFVVASKGIFQEGQRVQVKFTNALLLPGAATSIAAIILPSTDNILLLFSELNNLATDNVLGNPNYPQTTLEIEIYN